MNAENLLVKSSDPFLKATSRISAQTKWVPVLTVLRVLSTSLAAKGSSSYVSTTFPWRAAVSYHFQLSSPG